MNFLALKSIIGGGGAFALCISDPTNHERKLLQTKRLLDHIHAQTCAVVCEVEPDQFWSVNMLIWCWCVLFLGQYLEKKIAYKNFLTKFRKFGLKPYLWSPKTGYPWLCLKMPWDQTFCHLWGFTGCHRGLIYFWNIAVRFLTYSCSPQGAFLTSTAKKRTALAHF